MIASKPPNETGGSTKAARLRPHCTGTVFSNRVSVNDTYAQWRKEARRLHGEYQRTGNLEHFEAFRTHSAGMHLRGIEDGR